MDSSLSRFSSLFFALALTSLAVGCSRQNEGERCSITNGDQDCEGSLVCTNSQLLRRGDDGVDRCCPADLASNTDVRCARRTTSGDGDGDGDGDGGAGQGGMSSGSGGGGVIIEGDVGDNCSYNSDCNEPLLCVSGKCNVECKTDRDCAEGQTCSDTGSCSG